MRGQNPALRLRLRRIEKKPKQVFAAHWTDYAGIRANSALLDEFDDIVESIERGEGVPEAHYRSGVDLDPDDLLAQKGIMHLHLGGKDSDVLIFLIQYSDHVLLLETNTHIHFRTQPAGKNILALHQSWLGNLEREMEESAVRAKSAEAEEVRRAAETRRAAIAGSIMAFKRKAGLE